MSPLANSPPSSTPEPEMGSLPQDAAIVPKSATSQVLTGTNSPYQHFLAGASRFSSHRFLPCSAFSAFQDWNTHTPSSCFVLSHNKKPTRVGAEPYVPVVGYMRKLFSLLS